jgi:hypothetical protein
LTTKINLNYPVLPKDHQIWMVRPGSNYRLFKAFESSSAIAPDIPLLDLKNRKATAVSSQLDEQIRRGQEWREWEINGGQPTTKPSASLRDYTSPLDDGVSHTRSRNVAIQIFDIIPDGALIFVPGATLSDNALLGVVAKTSDDRVPVVRKWRGDRELAFLGRHLSNMKKIPMRLLPPEVTDLRKNRGSVVCRIDDVYACNRLYREYFQSFAIDGGDAYAQFRGGDAPFPAGALGSLVTLMRFAIEVRIEEDAANAENRPVRPVDAHRIAQLAWSTNDDLLIHAQVNSPFGRVTFQSARSAVFAATALTALATLNADAQVIRDLANKTAQVENICTDLASVSTATQIQSGEVQQTLYDFYAIFGAQTCNQVLEALRETVEKTQGQVDAEAEQ